MQQRGRARYLLDVVALEDELVLDVVRLLDRDAIHQLDLARLALAQEVAHLHRLLAQRDVDGEVVVRRAHLVRKALRVRGGGGKSGRRIRNKRKWK